MRDTVKSPPTFSTDSSLGKNWQGGRGRFLIDGFPRKMDQAIKFDQSVNLNEALVKQLLTTLGLRFLFRPVLLHYGRSYARQAPGARQDQRKGRRQR